MNKLIIPIIVVVIVAIGIGAFLIFQKPAFPQPPIGKCGDGVCDAKENANPDLCPGDCQEEILQITQQELEKGWYWGGKSQKKAKTPAEWAHSGEGTRSACWHKPGIRCGRITVEPSLTDEDSPFGIFGPYEWKLDSPNVVSVTDINNYLNNIRIKWAQEMYFTEELNDIPEGINIYSRVGNEGGNKPPNTTEKYKEELRKVIKKYKEKIKYWEVGTEPSGFPPPMGWQGYAKKYATHLKETYKIIKEECPDCYVVFGGLSGVGTGFNENMSPAKFLKEVLQEGAGSYFDVFEFKQHAANANDYQELQNRMEVFGKILADYGIDIKNIPVFVETATHDGNPSLPTPGVKLSSQTEVQQAAGLLKYYVYGLKSGIDKIFWNLVIERHNFSGRSDNPFNFYGLVNNSDNDGQSHKKLAYYTYKKMVEILEGSDWDNIQTIQESDGVYIYRLTKQGKPIWVAWNDNSGNKNITISGINSNQVKITEAVPKYKSGKEVTDYSAAFNTETKSVSSGKLTIILIDKPVFVEEK